MRKPKIVGFYKDRRGKVHPLTENNMRPRGGYIVPSKGELRVSPKQLVERREKHNIKSLARGIQVELEHTNDLHVAEKIALDHLDEDPEYYSKLASIEPKEGWRVGSPQVTRADKVIGFEVEELGNSHLLRDISEVLQCKPELLDIMEAIKKRWGENAKAIWMCDEKKDAEASYGTDFETKKKYANAEKVTLPSNAEVVSDLGSDGKLYVYAEEAHEHYKF